MNGRSRRHIGLITMQIGLITHVHITYKNFRFKLFTEQSLTKYQILNKLTQISHIHRNRIFLSKIGDMIDQLLLSYKFYANGISKIYFFILTSCEPFYCTTTSFFNEKCNMLVNYKLQRVVNLDSLNYSSIISSQPNNIDVEYCSCCLEFKVRR